MRIGFSTIVNGSPENPTEGGPFDPGVVELCAYNQDRWEGLRARVRDLQMPVGLHCPLPFDGWVKHFEVTGPDAERRQAAFSLIKRTLDAARELGADYVVTHYPTVFTALNTEDDKKIDSAQYRAAAIEEARHLFGLAKQRNLTLYLENVGPNPHFHSAQHYLEVFEAVPDLQMCLDFGHAHALDLAEDVYQFTETIAPHVASVHLYNTSRASYRVGFHEAPAVQGQDPKQGWMDLRRLLSILQRKAPLRYVVFEYSKAPATGSREVLEEVRALKRWIEERNWCGA